MKVTEVMAAEHFKKMAEAKTKEEALKLRYEMGVLCLLDVDADYNQELLDKYSDDHPEEYKAQVEHVSDLGVTYDECIDQNMTLFDQLKKKQGGK